jgi:hypothetical protein
MASPRLVEIVIFLSYLTGIMNKSIIFIGMRLENDVMKIVKGIITFRFQYSKCINDGTGRKGMIT